ncbi:sigma-54 interaction domain-containing protein [Caminicella sporogenes]|uniref:sigma-54 interaction domain-containing protein n=1 Tax=Caminicella sporogenes TaxID=166485 RepID=UPI00253FB352|nr:sigma 54-interacting transcriptional regulator [Caminicella sporogenes]WIF95066.1 sigma 54-interacting transcriptional regulator [Caminicella sporogenes]
MEAYYKGLKKNICDCDVKNNLDKVDEEKNYFDILNTILDTVNEWLVVTDDKGIITMMSRAYKEFLKDPNPEGKHVTEVIENTRLHKVLETGVREVGEIQEIKGNRMIAMRIPIIKDGKVIGAVGKGMFKDISDFMTLSKKINRLEKELEYYKGELNKEKTAKYSFEHIVGSGKKITDIKKMAQKIAKTDSNVLILGESGTGKELLAHSIHNASNRRFGPFIRINCAAIPSELLESELFGYDEGAFTGAKKGGKKGKFELANGGTILLDEIGDMSMHMQAKLLRVIQEKEVERLGGNKRISLDVRIIASTNMDLEKLVEEKKFREDLYYRLNVITIKLPPLRERKEDIEELANALRIKVSNRLGIYVEGISSEALRYLKAYDWPGNIRELENVIERAINLLDSDLIIQPKHLPKRLRQNKKISYLDTKKTLKDIIEEIEKNVIRECLEKTNGNKNKAAKILGLSRTGLYKKLERYNIK